MILRPSYQIPAVDAVGEHLQKHASTLLVLATGLGKTVCAAEIIKRTVEATGKLVLFLAHRSELIWQAKRAIEAHTGFECGIEMASERVEHSLFAKHKSEGESAGHHGHAAACR
jgi:superfamily II DNA or RNA helicase